MYINRERGGGGQWSVYYTSSQNFIITFFISWLKNFGNFNEFWFVDSISLVFKRCNHWFLSTEGFILCLVIGDVHHLIGHCLIPLYPWCVCMHYFTNISGYWPSLAIHIQRKLTIINFSLINHHLFHIIRIFIFIIIIIYL